MLVLVAASHTFYSKYSSIFTAPSSTTFTGDKIYNWQMNHDNNLYYSFLVHCMNYAYLIGAECSLRREGRGDGAG